MLRSCTQTSSDPTGLWARARPEPPAALYLDASPVQADPRTDALAAQAVARLPAHLAAAQPGGTSPMAPGWQGSAVFRVEGAAGPPLCLKIPGAPAPGPGGDDAYAVRVRAGRREARRAEWAGLHHVAPAVVHTDVPTGGFFSAFCAGAVPTWPHLEPYRVPLMATLAELHGAPAEALQGWPEATPNPFFATSLDEALAAGKALTRRQADLLLQLQAACARALAPCQVDPVPTHGDCKPLNWLVAQPPGASPRAQLIDWPHAQLGDRDGDLAYLACRGGIGAAGLRPWAEAYSAASGRADVHADVVHERSALLLVDTCLRTVGHYVKIDRYLDFADHFVARIRDDVQHLAPTLRGRAGYDVRL